MDCRRDKRNRLYFARLFDPSHWNQVNCGEVAAGQLDDLVEIFIIAGS
jgi:hypothetical protein